MWYSTRKSNAKMATASSSRTVENPFMSISELPPSHQYNGESSRSAQPPAQDLQPSGFQQWPQSYGQPVTPYRPSRNQDEEQLQTPRRIRAWNNAKIGIRIANVAICVGAMAITFSFPLKSRAGHINMSTSPVVRPLLDFVFLWCRAGMTNQCSSLSPSSGTQQSSSPNTPKASAQASTLLHTSYSR